MSFVEYERDGATAWLTLNRPERLNAVHLAMRDELWAALQVLSFDPTVHVAVLRGAGDRAFSAGADVLEFGTAPSLIAAREARLGRDLWALMLSLEIPLIAAIHGYAYGAGMEMSLLCDLRVASDEARFALPEVTLGYIPSAGGTQTVPRHLPSGEALRLVTSGDPMDASRAFELGLVHDVVPASELADRARSMAARLASMPPAALRHTKRALREGAELPLAEALRAEHRMALRSRVATDA